MTDLQRALMNVVNALNELKRVNPNAYISISGHSVYCGCTLSEVEITGNEAANEIRLKEIGSPSYGDTDNFEDCKVSPCDIPFYNGEEMYHCPYGANGSDDCRRYCGVGVDE